MKLLSHFLLLVVMLASQKCQESGDWIDGILSDIPLFFQDVESIIRAYEISDVPEPNITVYQHIEDRDNVIVMCKFGKTHSNQSFELSVESELNYTMELLKCSSSDSSEICVFLVTVSPPASFTCEHMFADFHLDFIHLHSQTYNYSESVFYHYEEGVSLFCICFSSFIVVGLCIMTAAVIMANIRSKTKDTINPTAVINNDYMEA